MDQSGTIAREDARAGFSWYLKSKKGANHVSVRMQKVAVENVLLRKLCLISLGAMANTEMEGKVVEHLGKKKTLGDWLREATGVEKIKS